MKLATVGRLLVGIVALGIAPVTSAQPYSIPWSTVDGGGHSAITGGTYTLRGTIGQHDASGALTGGAYSLSGGYWVGSVANPTPTASISDVSLAEGNAGTTNATFTVTLSFATGLPVSVGWQTRDLSATAGTDYVADAQTLNFAPGEVSKQISVAVMGDSLLESDETFGVMLTVATNAAFLKSEGIATIVNDDGTPPSRVFVSEAGSDAGTCSNQLTPCRNLTAAIGQVAIDGEVIVLTPGEYDASTPDIVIGKGLKITSPSGTVAFVRARFVVTAGVGSVVLRGLTIKGAQASTGITLGSATSLSLEEITVDGWQTGLWLVGSSGKVSITNSAFVNNTDYGVLDSSTTGRLAVSGTRFEGRIGSGISAQGSGSITVRDSSLVMGSGTAVDVVSGSVDVQQSLILHTATGISVSGGTLRLGGSLLFGNGIGINVTGGTAQSFGNNALRKNTTDVVGTVTLIPQQ